MAYRLLALDLDGTLLDDEKNISERNRSAIVAAEERGVLVTLSTGRMYSASVHFAEELNMTVPFVSYDGALVKDVAGQVYRELLLPLEAAHRALEVAEKHDIHVNVFLDDRLHVDRDDEWTQRYRRFTSGVVEVPALKDALYKGPNKVVLIGDDDRLGPAREALETELKGIAHITTAHPKFVEIVHPEASKKSGIQYLLEKYEITPEEVIAIGDNYNDLEIIKFAGLGVAMANAPEDIRVQADFVADSNTRDGVAQVIEKFILMDTLG